MSNEMPKDIAAELRVRAAIEQVKGSLFERAADEIERLREELRVEKEELAACCIDRKETQRERDEARREVCVWSCRVVRADRWMPTERVALGNEEDVAKSRNWDCFKEESRGDD